MSTFRSTFVLQNFVSGDSLSDEAAKTERTKLLSPEVLSSENRWTKESFTMFI